MVEPAALTIAIGVLACAGFSLLARGMRVLDTWGALLSFALGVVIVLTPGNRAEFEGFLWLGLLILFVMAGFGITRLFWDRKTAKGVTEAKSGVRGWRNVAANGLVPAIMAFLAIWVERDVVALGFVAAIAAASSDTFASELGVLSDRTYLITNPRTRVPPGMNGGVSNWGHLMALLGAVFPVAAAVLMGIIAWHVAWIPVLAGWLGCQLDSVLGALFEEERGRIYGFMSKSDVNFIAIAVSAFSVLLVAV